MAGETSPTSASVRARLKPLLFPEVAPVDRAWLAFVPLALAAGTAVAVLRAAGAATADTIWAEDGNVFLADAVNRGFADSLFLPYAGYMHGLPRLIAALAAALPPDRAALVFAVGSALACTALAVFTFFASRAFIASAWLRLVVAASVVFLPVAAYEVLANAANLHWFLLYAGLWALLWRPRSTTGLVVSAVVAVLAATSDGLALAFVPLAVLRLFVVDSARDRVVPAAYCVAAAVQLAVVLTASSTMAASGSPVSVAKLYGLRVVTASALGHTGTTKLFVQFGWPGVVVVAGVVVAAIVAGLYFAPFAAKVRAVLLLGVSGGFFFVPVMLRWDPAFWPSQYVLDFGSRYSVLPSLALLAALAVIVDSLVNGRWAAAVALVILVPSWFVDFRIPTLRDPSLLRWSDAVAAARQECNASDADQVAVPVLPTIPTVAVLSCRYIER